MVVVKVLDKIVHVLEITRRAPVPLAHSDLLLAIVVVLRHARVVVWRCRHRTIGVLGQLFFLVWRHDVDVCRGRRGRADIQTWSLAGPLVVVGRGFVAEMAAALYILGKVVAAVLGEV